MRRMGRWPSAQLSFDRDQCMVPLADGSEGRIFAGMVDILESAPRDHEEPKLVIRKAPHVPVWSVWAVLEGTHSEELFGGPLRKRRRIGSIAPVKLGLKNAGENAMRDHLKRTRDPSQLANLIVESAASTVAR